MVFAFRFLIVQTNPLIIT